MSIYSKEELENLLEDVVNELDLSDAAIEKHGPLGTAPAELVRLVLAQKDSVIRNLRADTNDADRIEKLEAELEGEVERRCLKYLGKIKKLEDELDRTRRERDEARRAIEKLGTNDFDWDVLGELDRLQTEVKRLQKREAVR